MAQIRWWPRLKMVWAKRQRLESDWKTLYKAALAEHFQGVQGDFEAKVRGSRPAAPGFPELLFRAAGLDREGLSLEAWTGTNEQWAEAVDALGTTRVRDELVRMMGETALTVGLSSRPFPDARPHPAVSSGNYRRAGNPDDNEQVITSGQELVLSLTYTGDRALLNVYLILLEYMGENEDWQVFSALEWSKVRSSRSVVMSPTEKGLGLEIGLGLKASTPSSGYELFVCLSANRFDHKVITQLGRLERDNPTGALLRHGEVSELIQRLEVAQPDLIIGKTNYRIQ